MRLWNEIGVIITCGEKENRSTEAKELAVRLEYWHREYKQLWRSVSRESELYRITEIIFFYADYLRKMA
jgi:predicted patatin/cPLA2 family phospholipase